MLALLGGVALGLSASPRQYFKTFRKIRHEWKKIDQRNFNRSFRRLSHEKLIEEKTLTDEVKKKLNQILEEFKQRHFKSKA